MEKKKEKLVPRLRFPGFSGEWEKKPLHEIGKKITEKNKDNLVVNVLTNSAQYGLIRQNDFFDKDIANQENTNKYYVIKYGDFVYNPRKSVTAPYGPIRINTNKEDGIVSPLYICFRINSPETDNQYLARYFESSSWYEYIKVNGNIGARNDRVSITDKVLMNMPISIPSLPEQEKIADFFSALDAKIDLKKKEIEDVKSMKKGFLQKMFPQDRESVPRLRFPEFSGKWEKKKLGEIAPLRGGFAFKSDKYTKSGIPIIRISNILSNGLIGNNFVYYKPQKNDKNYCLTNGDIVIAMSGATTGKIAVLKYPDKIKYYQNQRVGMFTKKNNNIIYTFIKVIIESNKFAEQLNTVLTAGAQPNISPKEINNFEFSIPSLPEQEKIADFFSTLDAKINAMEKQLEDLKEMKKGFLQQMFI